MAILQDPAASKGGDVGHKRVRLGRQHRRPVYDDVVDRVISR